MAIVANSNREEKKEKPQTDDRKGRAWSFPKGECCRIHWVGRLQPSYYFVNSLLITTAVMLSSPPARLASFTSARHARSGDCRLWSRTSKIRLSSSILVRPSVQSRKKSSG